MCVCVCVCVCVCKYDDDTDDDDDGDDDAVARQPSVHGEPEHVSRDGSHVHAARRVQPIPQRPRHARGGRAHRLGENTSLTHSDIGQFKAGACRHPPPETWPQQVPGEAMWRL